ncbi:MULTISPECIES: sensor histidine kinase [unclassified Polaribacter]|uniref:sensor histidine kinase n=1 Tax=unclassified Polaribacter TaxID=196858 RepID=UPI0011BDAE02|nr:MULTISPECIES: HAMP domain-containing sensor histidine kinase [unclassified Polaribacter]TXD50957.1 HAMP domain-containing histidine kinase [Polaribacter sp. IC063]TXD57774.1 HAMP domain-containing histidine kinase [Polaribacter sp. IC066]
MIKTEAALKERIKELTCLYEISSIIGDASADFIEDTLNNILFSLKKGFQFPLDTNMTINTEIYNISTTETINKSISINANITVFKELKGTLFVCLDPHKYTLKDFLHEEQLLIDNIAIKVGGFLERVAIQQNETSLKRQMEHADRLSIVGEITAGIAHELNTPLANILGFAELLKDSLKGSLNEKNGDIDKIIDNAIYSREVVKKLMFFSCKMPQEMQLINFVPVIRNAIKLLDATFRKENVKPIINIKGEDLWLKADSVQITQILFNLLMNAIYFSPKNGLVTIQASETKKNIVLKISDEGKGFIKEDLPKIFQPFFSTKPIGDGAGLGLSVVHGIVSSHKGNISAKNNIHKGAVFTVILPKN